MKYLMPLVILVLLFSCANKKDYADWVKVTGDILDTMETFMADVDKGKGADDHIQSANKAAAAMKSLVPRIKEMDSKYPELKKFDEEKVLASPEYPENLKNAVRRMQPLLGKWKQYGNRLKQIHDQEKNAEKKKALEKAFNDLDEAWKNL